MLKDIHTLQDIITNFNSLKDKEIYFYDGTWEIDNEVLDQNLFNSLFLCNLIQKENTVISHHSFHIYKIKEELTDLDLQKFKSELIRLFLYFKQNNKRFNSLTQVKDILNRIDFSSRCTTIFNNNCCYWSSNKYIKCLHLKSKIYPRFTYDYIYYNFISNVINKGMILKTLARLLNNLFYNLEYPSLRNKDRYSLEDNKFNRKLYNEDYTKFINQLTRKISEEQN